MTLSKSLAATSCWAMNSVDRIYDVPLYPTACVHPCHAENVILMCMNAPLCACLAIACQQLCQQLVVRVRQGVPYYMAPCCRCLSGTSLALPPRRVSLLESRETSCLPRGKGKYRAFGATHKRNGLPRAFLQVAAACAPGVPAGGHDL
eukprot:364003-Chlamydomonas_euryale.AAC.36